MDATNLFPQAISPTAYQLGLYGRTPVSYFHGLPQISVPLTEVRGRGFTLPVSLSYHGGGIKPEQHPGWVGLGWSLHAGGCITRIIHGKKDEFSRLEHNHLYGQSLTEDPGYIYHMSDIQSGQAWTESELTQRLNPNIDEYEPDEYIVSAPGISATFVIVGDRQIRVKSREESCITLESYEIANDGSIPCLNLYPGQGDERLKACRFKYIRTIVLRDKEGNRYLFGGTEESIEYSVVQYPHYSSDSAGNIVNTGQWNAVATANTWMLTRIERSDGEAFEFSYSRSGVPIVFRDIHRGSIYGFNERPVRWPRPYIGSLDRMDDTDTSGSFKRNYRFQFLFPSYLRRIRCLLSGDVLDFDIEESTELGYSSYTEEDFRLYVADLHDGSVESYFPYSSFRENDYYMRLSSIRGKGRHIILDYTSNPQTRLKLTGVRILGGPMGSNSCDDAVDGSYAFAYDALSLPEYNSKMTDVWGYYNGRCYKTPSGSLQSDFDRLRVPSEDFMRAETLVSVRYPTGGWTDYEWEAHVYGMTVFPPDFVLEPTESPSKAGGLRIRSITDHTSIGHSSTRLFSYESGGTSSGILSVPPSCVANGYHEINNAYLECSGFFSMYCELPVLPLSDTDGSHVTYTDVRETFEDGGYAEYHYSNNDQEQYRDRMPFLEVGRVEGNPLFPEITSRSILRGLLLRKALHDAGGCLVCVEEMEYGSIDDVAYMSAAKQVFCSGYIVFYNFSQEPCGYPALLSRTVRSRCDDGTFMEDRYEYQYNVDRLLVSESHSRGHSYQQDREDGTKFFYPADRPGQTSAQMIADGFKGVVLGTVKLRDGKVVAAQELSYKNMHIPSWDGTMHTWRPSRQWTGRFESPVDPGTYNASPMAHMDSTPDVEVKLFDGTAAPHFAGSKDGSATEWHWPSHHGQPGMVLKTFDMDFPDTYTSEVHDLVLNEQVIVEGTFRITRASTFMCGVTPQYGYAFHISVAVDGVIREIVQWSRGDMPNDHWEELIQGNPVSASMTLEAGEHSFRVLLLEWNGPGGPAGTSGGSVRLAYYRAVESGGAGTFLSLDDEGENGEGFHCEHGHAGPLTVNRSIPYGRDYVLDYMERDTDGEWHYVRSSYAGGNVTIGGEGKAVSHVRIYPSDSMPESYSYRDFVGMTAKTDARGVSESYGYDALGRLSEVRDDDGNILSGSIYTFATAEGGSGTDNTVESRLFTSEDGSSSRLTVSHMDGLGRPVQETIVDGGGAGRDIITRKEYDNVGRELRNLVPTPSDADGEDFSDDARWTENEYEESPRDRVLSVTGPGQAWRDAHKKVSTLLYANSTTVPELMHRGFSVTDSDGNPLTADRRLLRNSGLTPDGLLNVTKTINEDEEVTLVFSDVHGEEVLTRRVLTDDVTGEVTYADTHTVRDALGRIAAVIPPKLTAQLGSSQASQWNYSEIEDLAFLYRYDSRSNCIEKNIPGGGWTYMAYDKGGRCVFSQDAVQREQGRWAFRLVDIHGRECVTGTVVRTMDVSADPIASTNIYVSMPASPDYSGSLKGYDLNGISSLGTDVRILTVCYYDGYGFNEGSTMTAYSEPAAGEPYGRMGSHPVTGLLTGRLARVLDGTDSETFLRGVMYYDDKARVIQRCSTTMFGRADRESLGYDFAGNVVARKLVHGKPSSLSTYTEKLTCSYDAMGRPLETTHRSGTAAVRLIASREYDSIGRLASVGRAGQTMTALQQNYSYNIRSWLTGISGDLFTEVIRHEDSSTPRWGGKISETSWRNPGETSDRGYVYRYDGLARLTAAEYADVSGSGLFTEGYGYDLNGNMTSRTKAVQLTDSSGNTTLANLVARNSYTGNRMRSMPMETVTYDACGRLTGESSGKVRSIRYNEIGLPQEMTLSDGSTVNVVYAADGRKLRERVTTGSSSVIRNYSGNCIYEGSVLKKVLFDGGYAQMSGNTPTYQFFLTDHLGSVRVVADENGSVRQVNQYYPYGDLIEDARMVESTSDNRYRFTGKELATETGLYDFCARYLETSMGRFTTIDPLAEKYPSISPYAYCAGDPVNRVDPDGRDPIYQIRKGNLQNIGDDGRDGGMIYLVKGTTARRIRKQGFDALDRDLFSDKNSIGVPLGAIKNQVISSFEDTLSQGREQGGHATTDGNVNRWDSGGDPTLTITEGDKTQKASAHIRPFFEQGKPSGGSGRNVSVYWHTHPDVSVGGVWLGSSNPSEKDLEYQRSLMKNNGYEGGAFVIGAREKMVTFYKTKIIVKVKWDVIKDL